LVPKAKQHEVLSVASLLGYRENVFNLEYPSTTGMQENRQARCSIQRDGVLNHVRLSLSAIGGSYCKEDPWVRCHRAPEVTSLCHCQTHWKKKKETAFVATLLFPIRIERYVLDILQKVSECTLN
jgi:hypothetical protein